MKWWLVQVSDERFEEEAARNGKGIEHFFVPVVKRVVLAHAKSAACY